MDDVIIRFQLRQAGKERLHASALAASYQTSLAEDLLLCHEHQAVERELGTGGQLTAHDGAVPGCPGPGSA